jgi:hypothetical protein
MEELRVTRSQSSKRSRDNTTPSNRSHRERAYGGGSRLDTVSRGWIGRMDMKVYLRSFWPAVAVAALPGSGCVKYGSGREHYQTEPQSLIWAAGQVFPSPRFWSRRDLTSLASMQRHPLSRHSDAIFQTHPSSVKRSKIRHFSAELRRGPGMGAHVFAVCRRPTTSDPKRRRHIGAGWSVTFYIPCGTVDMERCNDELGIMLPWSRMVSETALSRWPVGNE